MVVEVWFCLKFVCVLSVKEGREGNYGWKYGEFNYDECRWCVDDIYE